jgi:hypothetical protein
VAHYLFNLVAPREQATALTRLRMWGVGAEERHGDALAPGDLVLLYLGAPASEFVGRGELASAVRAWTPEEAEAYPGESSRGVLLAHVEEWDPPVPMSAVLARIESPQAKAEFDEGVVEITGREYETALAVAEERRRSPAARAESPSP